MPVVHGDHVFGHTRSDKAPAAFFAAKRLELRKIDHIFAPAMRREARFGIQAVGIQMVPREFAHALFREQFPPDEIGQGGGPGLALAP